MKIDYQNVNSIDHLPAMPGIYWLFESINGLLNLVYIGKSCNLRQRLKQHYNSVNGPKFNYFTYDLCPNRILEKIEKEVLLDYTIRLGSLPKYNKQLG
jgi:excinuclease UvrABC nuclease subunit